MLYQIRLQYCFHVEAGNQATAYQAACRLIRENPGNFISAIKMPEPTSGKSFMKRLITGA